MSQFNKFNLYSLGYQQVATRKLDEIDKHIDFLKFEDEYEEVRNYIEDHFGTFKNDKWLEFPDLNKSLYIFVNDEKVEFCAQKNHKDYYGKGWKKIKIE